MQRGMDRLSPQLRPAALAGASPAPTSELVTLESSYSCCPPLSHLSARLQRQWERGISMPLYSAGTMYCSSLGHKSYREE